MDDMVTWPPAIRLDRLISTDMWSNPERRLALNRRPDASRFRGGTGSMTPASFSLVQCLYQFLNQQNQFRWVTFVCHRKTKFSPVFLGAVSHIRPPTYVGLCVCEHFVWPRR